MITIKADKRVNQLQINRDINFICKSQATVLIIPNFWEYPLPNMKLILILIMHNNARYWQSIAIGDQSKLSRVSITLNIGAKAKRRGIVT